MLEEFGTTLKLTLDNSSLQKVKANVDSLKKSIEEPAQIVVKMSKEQLEASLKEAEAELKLWQEKLKSVTNIMDQYGDKGASDWGAQKAEEAKNHIAEIETAIEEIKKDLEGADSETQKAVENTKIATKSAIDYKKQIGQSASGIKQLVGGLIGAVTVYRAIRKAMSTYLAQNEELQQKLNACYYAVGSLFAPVLEFLVNLFVKLLSYVNAIIKALGFAGFNMKKFGKSAGSAGKAMKQLAGFDEINNLNKDTGGGGGGVENPFDNIKLGEAFQEYIARIREYMDEVRTILAGSAFVIGAILTFTGANIPLGLGLMAVGAYEIGRQIAVNWNAMSESLARTIATITGLIAGASLAIGGMLTLGGFASVGIPLLLIGATSLVASIAVNWHTMENKISAVLDTITTVVSGAFLVIGALFTLSGVNIPLGIGLLLAGATTIGVKMAKVNWNDVTSKVGKTMKTILSIASTALLGLGVILAFTGNIPLGVALISAGAVGLVSNFGVNWDALGEKISTSLGSIAETFTTKWNGIKSFVGGVWNDLTKSAGETWSNIKTSASTAWEGIKTSAGNAWEKVKTSGSKAWDGISTAWAGAKSWFGENVTNPIAKLFGKDGLETSIGTSASNAVKNYQNGFGGIGNWVQTNIVDVVKNKIKDIETIDPKININYNIPDPTTGIRSLFEGKSINIPVDFQIQPFDVDKNGKITPKGYGQVIMGKRVGSFDVGANYVPNDMLAMVHKGEAIVPERFNNEKFFGGGNEETNDLLQFLINIVQSKEFTATISKSDVGKASVDYINSQSRILGRSIV